MDIIKRPEVIADARQYDGTDKCAREIALWIDEHGGYSATSFAFKITNDVNHTEYINEGDWVVMEARGLFHRYTNAQFVSIYEPFVEKDSPTFAQELCVLINKHSMEKYSDTPDWVLCEYLLASLKAFDLGVRMREGDDTVQLLKKDN